MVQLKNPTLSFWRASCISLVITCRFSFCPLGAVCDVSLHSHSPHAWRAPMVVPTPCWLLLLFTRLLWLPDALLMRVLLTAMSHPALLLQQMTPGCSLTGTEPTRLQTHSYGRSIWSSGHMLIALSRLNRDQATLQVNYRMNPFFEYSSSLND